MSEYFWSGFPGMHLGIHPLALVTALFLTVTSLTLFFLLLCRHGGVQTLREDVSGRGFWLRAAAAFILSALLMGPSISVLQVPLQNWTLYLLMAHTRITNLLLLQFPVIMLSGLVQEPVKFLAVLAAGPGERRKQFLFLGVLAGAAYGGMEALILLSIAFHYPDVTAANLAVVIFQRAFVILFHLSLTALVALYWSRSLKSGLIALLLAALVHSMLNYISVTAYPVLGVLVELFIAATAITTFIFLIKKTTQLNKEAV